MAKREPRGPHWALILWASLVVILVVPLGIGTALGDVVLSNPAGVSGVNFNAPAPLTVHNQNIAEHCGGPVNQRTVTIRATENAPKTQGTITITLPARCQGVTLTFNAPGLQFHSLNFMSTGMAIESNPPWAGGTAGTIRTCVSLAGGGCRTSQIVLTSGSGSPPTSVVNIANGRNFGPWVRTTGLTGGETATIVLFLYLDWRNTATGNHAVIQVDQITLVVHQV